MCDEIEGKPVAIHHNQIAWQVNLMTGREFAVARKSLGLTQARLAEKFEVSRVSIIRIEALSEVDRSDEYALRWLMHTAGGREAVSA